MGGTIISAHAQVLRSYHAHSLCVRRCFCETMANALDPEDILKALHNPKNAQVKLKYDFFSGTRKTLLPV